MLKIKELSIKHGSRILLDKLSLSLSDTGITALLGPSGCGKSSVLKWLSGTLAPELKSSGSAYLDELEIKRPNGCITWHPQGDTLFPWATALQNSTLGLEIAGTPKEKARQLALERLSSFGLSGLENQYPEQLSGGMRQRVAFLRSMLPQSRYLLLDEPFSALDAVTRLGMQQWLLARIHAQPRSLLLVTHDLHEATYLADRILVMAANPGRIIADLPLVMPHAERDELNLAALREHLKSLLLEDIQL